MTEGPTRPGNRGPVHDVFRGCATTFITPFFRMINMQVGDAEDPLESPLRLKDLPPLPRPNRAIMRSEACTGVTTVLVLIGLLMGIPHAVRFGAGWRWPSDGLLDSTAICFLCLYAESTIAILCLLGLIFGDPGALKRSPERCFPIPAAVIERIRSGQPTAGMDNVYTDGQVLSELAYPGRCGQDLRSSPLFVSVCCARCRHAGVLCALLHLAPPTAAKPRGRLVLRRSRRECAPLLNLPALRLPLRPPLRRLRPVHRWRWLRWQHGVLQDHSLHGLRGLRDVLRHNHFRHVS